MVLRNLRPHLLAPYVSLGCLLRRPLLRSAGYTAYHNGDDGEDQGDDPHNLAGPVRTLRAEVVAKAAEDVPGNSMEETPFIKKRPTTAHRAPSTPIIDEQRGRDLDRSLKAAQGQKLQPHYRTLPVIRQRTLHAPLPAKNSPFAIPSTDAD